MKGWLLDPGQSRARANRMGCPYSPTSGPHRSREPALSPPDFTRSHAPGGDNQATPESCGARQRCAGEATSARWCCVVRELHTSTLSLKNQRQVPFPLESSGDRGLQPTGAPRQGMLGQVGPAQWYADPSATQSFPPSLPRLWAGEEMQGARVKEESSKTRGHGGNDLNSNGSALAGSSSG